MPIDTKIYQTYCEECHDTCIEQLRSLVIPNAPATWEPMTFCTSCLALEPALEAVYTSLFELCPSGRADALTIRNAIAMVLPGKQGVAPSLTLVDIHRIRQQDRALKAIAARIPKAGVYILQLSERANVFKIGFSTQIRKRLPQLSQPYAPFRYIALISHEKPAPLERELHARFAAMRLYKGSSATELFQFTTKRQQRLFARFLAEHPTCCIEPVIWEGKASTAMLDISQPSLFAQAAD